MTRQFVPPGYRRLEDLRSETSDEILRGKLATGELQAFKIREGELDSIGCKEWIDESGEAMLACSYWAPRFHKYANGWAAADDAYRGTFGRSQAIVVADPPKQTPEAESNGKGRAGRKPEFDWNAFMVEAVYIAHLDGLPDVQGDFERQMLEWCGRAWGREPSESTIREKISPIYQRLARGRK